MRQSEDPRTSKWKVSSLEVRTDSPTPPKSNSLERCEKTRPRTSPTDRIPVQNDRACCPLDCKQSCREQRGACRSPPGRSEAVFALLEEEVERCRCPEQQGPVPDPAREVRGGRGGLHASYDVCTNTKVRPGDGGMPPFLRMFWEADSSCAA